MGPFDYDRYLVDQLIRPIANLYRVTPLAAGETPAGPPIAYVRQKKLKIKEEIRFYGDEAETQELFQLKARTWLDTGGSKYDVIDAQGREHRAARACVPPVAVPLDLADLDSTPCRTARSRNSA